MKKSTIAAVLIFAATCRLAAHDLFIMPERFRVSSGQTLTVGLHNGDGFPESVSAPQRIRDTVLHGPRGASPVQDLHVDGKRMVGAVGVPGNGHFIVTTIASANQ